MCGLSELTDKPIFDPSLFVTVRKRISEEEINEMTTKLLKEEQRRKAEAEKNKKNGQDQSPQGSAASKTEKAEDTFAKEFTDSEGRQHKGVLKIDATCANAEVRYPVDVDIIRDGCIVVNRYIKKICISLFGKDEEEGRQTC